MCAGSEELSEEGDLTSDEKTPCTRSDEEPSKGRGAMLAHATGGLAESYLGTVTAQGVIGPLTSCARWRDRRHFLE